MSERTVSRSMCSASSGTKDPRPYGGAFVEHCDLKIAGALDGPLKGLTFAVKDLYDVTGVKTGFGNPTWLETHDVAQSTAPTIQALLDAGASIVGKTQMDELAYSINGENVHYGTPLNPRAPTRIPGGSSSGSATAVALGICDFAMGSDTGGSVRVPASYCGLPAIRPTHARVSMEGTRPLAPSFDTGGWFAKDFATLQSVGRTILDGNRSSTPITKWLVGTDAFKLADEAATQAIYSALSGNDSAVFNQMVDLLGTPIETCIARHNEELSSWFDTFRVIQASEVWKCHGEWVQTANPDFGPGISDRFKMASQISVDQVATATNSRAEIIDHLDNLLSDGAVLMIPSTPGPGPVCNLPAKELESFRGRALALTSVAGLGGLPQLNVPVAEVAGSPVGLGIIGSRGSDEMLLELGTRLESILAEAYVTAK